MQTPKKALIQLLASNQMDYPVHSRVHKLKVSDGVYIKREDELGFLLSGSKVRKYRSLIHAFTKKNIKKIGLIGSQYSNHVLGLSSLLIENEIEPTLFLLEAKEPPPLGNGLFIKLLVPEKNIHLISREHWKEVSALANAWQAENSQFNACVLPEGGADPESIRGLVTLALDILQNEKENSCCFKEILIDSGTGITAATLIAAFGFLKKKVHIHVCLAAGTSEYFMETLTSVKTTLEQMLQRPITELPRLSLHQPPTARSFGSTNTKIFQTIVRTAQSEGFFLDPIYSCKLYLMLEELLKSNSLQKPILFIHSGGLFSLAGFQEQLNVTLSS